MANPQTDQEFNAIASECETLFTKKMKDYGTAWRILRLPSLTDQIFIKAQRIRSIQEKGEAKIQEGIRPEFIGILNYSVMALIQLELGVAETHNAFLEPEKAVELFHRYLMEAKLLMLNKNHDYDEAWRKMRISSFCDIILMKLLRIKQIEDNQGKTLVSEGLDANYMDIINYAVFALILMGE